MKNVYRSLAVVTLSMLFVSQSFAGLITYNVNRDVGSSSVIGTITTDGTIGVLDDNNITSFSLTLMDLAYTVLITESTGGTHFVSSGNALPGATVGSPLTATATQLLFDFSSTGFVHFQLAPVDTGTPFWCLAGASSTSHCVNTTGAESIKVSKTPTVFYTSSNTGREVVVGNVVPEPSIIALFSLGLLGLGFARRRRTHT
jgi:hypothetical protein